MTGPRLTFGKYEGLTLGEAEACDRGYLLWLLSQNWLPGRYPELHRAVRKRVFSILKEEIEDEARIAQRRSAPPARRFMPVSEFLVADLV